MKILRKWRIPDKRAHMEGEDLTMYLSRLGVNTKLPWRIDQDIIRFEFVVSQECELDQPDQPSDLERYLLRRIVDDDELWFYEPSLADCGPGNFFHVLCHPPRISAFAPPEDAGKMMKIDYKTLEVKEFSGGYMYEVCNLLVAVDPESLEVYWCRPRNIVV